MSQVTRLVRVRHHGAPVFLGLETMPDGTRAPVWSAGPERVARWMASGFRFRFNQRRSCRSRYLTCKDREGNLVVVEAPAGERILVPLGSKVLDISDAEARKAHSHLAAMPSLVLEATGKTEAQDWFAAARRRKTNLANGRRPGRMPRFRSKKTDDDRFVCWFNGGRNAVLTRTGRRSAMVRITGQNPSEHRQEGQGLSWSLTFHVRLSQPIRPYTSVRINLTRHEVVFVNSPVAVTGRARTGEAIGIDRGVVHTVADSNGAFYDAPDLQHLERQRRFHQQRMAKSRLVAGRDGRTQGASKRYQAHKEAAAALSARESRIREDFAQQLSTSMVRAFDLFGVEDLSLSRMTRRAHGKGAAAKRALNRSLQNVALAQLAAFLEYKCTLAGIPFLKVPPAYTSQRCHACGYTCKENRESQAVFSCKRCAWSGNADYNAAINILELALEQWARTHGPAGSKGKTEARKDPARSAGGTCDEPRTTRAVA